MSNKTEPSDPPQPASTPVVPPLAEIEGKELEAPSPGAVAHLPRTRSANALAVLCTILGIGAGGYMGTFPTEIIRVTGLLTVDLSVVGIVIWALIGNDTFSRKMTTYLIGAVSIVGVLVFGAVARGLFYPPTIEVQGTPATLLQAPTTTQPATSTEKETTHDYSIDSNESLRRSAYKMAQEIDDFVDSFKQRGYKIYDDKSLSSSEKADQEEMLDNEVSEKFKAKFSYSYIPLQKEIINRVPDINYPYTFDETMIDSSKAELYGVSIKQLAKKLK
ncbi:MAG TPA: hypothetical protein VII20_20975 [Roseiarcus sp.]|jgi:hypothetical protein